jgi:hypothetical protein
MIMNQNSSPQSQWQVLDVAKQNRETEKPLGISVWVAPIIICVAVILLGLAVATLLLGNQ